MYTILVIEDDETMRRMLKKILEPNEDYRIILSDNGESGLGIARAELPDLILLDIVMPVMDGFQVLRELKDKTSTSLIPVIVITAMKNLHAMKEAIFEYGAEYLVKPFDTNVLRSTVARILAGSTEEDD